MAEVEWKPCDIEIKVALSFACRDGKCEECKGILHRDRPPSEWVFCTHECHSVRNKDV